MQYSEWLAWDTKMLAVKTAKLLPATLNPAQLRRELAELAANGAELVYWAADSQDAQTQLAAKECQGILVDQKITYLCDLSRLSFPALTEVVDYPDELPNQDLIELAYDSGLYSRFQTDPGITTAQFQAIYREWMTNSTKKLIAQRVLIIPKGQRIVAMVTLGEKQLRGDIGLLAVAEEERGKGWGKMLVRAAQQVFQEQGYQWSQVVTQKANQSACLLYEYCGYTVDKVEHFYHFWLRNK